MACKNYNPKAKIVYPGSRLQYGRIQRLPVTEEHPREPLSIYAIHKNTGEQYYQAFFKHYGICSTCFRITNPYGPRAQMKNSGHSLINWFIRLAVDNQIIKIYGQGEQLRDYIYIDDLVEGLILTMINDKSYGQIYNIGSGQPTKFIDMARLVVQTVGQGKIENIPWPKNYDNFETGDFYADISRLKNHIDWQPHTSLKDGIEKTFRYYQKYKKYYW
jgi:nucleoside-diphosphate-sugar epimerase